MNISINQSILNKYGMSIEEFLVLYLCSKDFDIEEIIKSLINKGFANRNLYNKVTAVISNNTKELISSILIDSDKSVIDKDEEFNRVAEKMKEVFPDGRKPGTTYYWKDSTAVIARKLKTLVAKFNFKFTEEQAITATREYVKSFNGDYQYMQLLKYFILKTDNHTGELRSDFMSIIENGNQQDNLGLNDSWLTEIR